MIVICLEGCHGCGKSTLTSLFEKSGYQTLDEAFLSMPELPPMSPQTMLMESIWIGNWFARLLNHSKENDDTHDQVFIADRSPFSAVCYAGQHGHLLEPVIRAQMEEVRKAAGIEIYSVHLYVQNEVLWKRIQARLAREPTRNQLNEGDRSHMEKIHMWYKGFSWDFVVDNSSEMVGGGELVLEEILLKIKGRSKRFRTISEEAGGPCGSPVSVVSLTKW